MGFGQGELGPVGYVVQAETVSRNLNGGKE